MKSTNYICDKCRAHVEAAALFSVDMRVKSGFGYSRSMQFDLCRKCLDDTKWHTTYCARYSDADKYTRMVQAFRHLRGFAPKRSITQPNPSLLICLIAALFLLASYLEYTWSIN